MLQNESVLPPTCTLAITQHHTLTYINLWNESLIHWWDALSLTPHASQTCIKRIDAKQSDVFRDARLPRAICIWAFKVPILPKCWWVRMLACWNYARNHRIGVDCVSQTIFRVSTIFNRMLFSPFIRQIKRLEGTSLRQSTLFCYQATVDEWLWVGTLTAEVLLIWLQAVQSSILPLVDMTLTTSGEERGGMQAWSPAVKQLMWITREIACMEVEICLLNSLWSLAPQYF